MKKPCRALVFTGRDPKSGHKILTRCNVIPGPGKVTYCKDHATLLRRMRATRDEELTAAEIAKAKAMDHGLE